MPTTASGNAGIAPAHTAENRIIALDGLRGMMTIMVVISHFFGEIPNGIQGLMFGYIAVIVFYVLSGFLVGRLILDKCDRANFFTVFYVRRFCRMIPAYFITLTVIFAVMWWIGDVHWRHADHPLPAWTYFAFVQNFYMASEHSIGAHWIAPTWTLAVEEHFYLLAPALLILTPRKYLLKGLIALTVMSIGVRFAIVVFEVAPPLSARVLIFSLADTLALGVLAAHLIRTPGIEWERYDTALRYAPLVLLAGAILLRTIDGDKPVLFDIFGATLIAAAGAAFILSLIRGAPEAESMKNPVLRFFGHNSYCIYLTHLGVLGLMHGLILGTRPDLVTWQQFAVSVVALPVAVFIGWSLTRLVEEPLTVYGRSWRWSEERRGERLAAGQQPRAA